MLLRFSPEAILGRLINGHARISPRVSYYLIDSPSECAMHNVKSAFIRARVTHVLRLFIRAVASGLLAASGLAQANQFCVSTAQELQDALTQASDGGMYSGEINEVLIAPGTYVTGSATGNQAFHYMSTATTGFLSISGGYGACAFTSSDPSETVLDGGQTTQVIHLLSQTTEIQIQGLTIQNGNSSDGGGLQINDEGGYNASVLVARCIIRNNQSASYGGGFFISADGSGQLLSLQNNLIFGNTATTDGGAGYLDSSGASASIINNTVTQNTAMASGSTGGIVDSILGHSSVTNNILWNNSNYGIFFSLGNADFNYNDYGTLGGAAPNMGPGNVSVSPRFVNASGGDFHLSGISTLLGVSSVIESGNHDLEGNAYPLGGKADLGAYEDTVFTDGFDGN